MNLGKLDVCLKVNDISKSAEFYKKLGFTIETISVPHGWCQLSNQNSTLALYTENHIKENILNFRGGDVFKIAEALKNQGLSFETDAVKESDGSVGATLRDPDGNLIYFNTSPQEAQ